MLIVQHYIWYVVELQTSKAKIRCQMYLYKTKNVQSRTSHTSWHL